MKAVQLIPLLSLVFGSGVLFERFSSKMPVQENARDIRQEIVSQDLSPEILDDAIAVTLSAPKAEMDLSEAVPVKPQVDEQRAPSSEAKDLEDRLAEVIEKPLPEGEILYKRVKEDGTLSIYERTQDGASIDRAFSPAGALKGESWFAASGEQILKSYYDNGRLRGLSWVLPDGLNIALKFNAEGMLRGRRDDLPGGDQLVTKYDDYGRVLEKWKVRKNGQRIKI